jgi:hypothetical protein
MPLDILVGQVAERLAPSPDLGPIHVLSPAPAKGWGTVPYFAASVTRACKKIDIWTIKIISFCGAILHVGVHTGEQTMAESVALTQPGRVEIEDGVGGKFVVDTHEKKVAVAFRDRLGHWKSVA